MKNPPNFTKAQVMDLESALEQNPDEKCKLRLETMLTVARQGKNLTAREIAVQCGIGRATLYRWMARYRMNGVGALLHRTYRRSAKGAEQAERIFLQRLMRTEHIKAKPKMEELVEQGVIPACFGILAKS